MGIFGFWQLRSWRRKEEEGRCRQLCVLPATTMTRVRVLFWVFVPSFSVWFSYVWAQEEVRSGNEEKEVVRKGKKKKLLAGSFAGGSFSRVSSSVWKKMKNKSIRLPLL
ncbi:unnamed protein product [Linum tenue]|uniref:Transmembrane protein n=1 Tax=Linum tenue TaxID=586396 RepID=A0AAV0S126_9ROSI|nr:unnamed protein product [Linum tenue]